MENEKPRRHPRSSVAFMGFRGGPGGISHVMLHLMNGFARMEIPTSILLNKTNIPELERLDPRIERVTLHPEPGLPAVTSLATYLQKKKPSVLLVNREPAVRTAILAKKRTGSDARIVIRVGMPISVALQRRSFLKRQLRRLSIRYCYRRADLIIANSEDVRRDVLLETGISPHHVQLIPNPTIADEIYRQASEPVDHPWFRPKTDPVIIAVGRLAAQKGFPTLLRAFAMLLRRRPSRLVILGDGKLRKSLLAQARSLGISQRVSLPGFTANPFAYVARSDLFVLSSAWEGSPNALIEALALGVPSVSTRCGSGPREILEEGRWGSLVPVGDPAAMTTAMLTMLENPPDPEKLKNAVARYRVETSARLYAQALELRPGSMP